MTTSLVSVEKVKAYLDEKSIPYTNVKELSGGVANWAYFVTQPEGPGVILKHTSIIVKGIPTMQAPAERADAEARALTVIPPLLKDVGSDVHPPILLHYDAEAHVQQQRPAGVRTLKDAYADKTLDIKSVGARMARWVASLHALPSTIEAGDDSLARQIYGGSYRGCPGTIERFGLDPSAAQAALKKYEPLLRTEAMHLCHGDFWTGNVLLPAEGETNPRLTIVDWEMCRRGCGATDVGQFAAEAWLLDQHRGNRGLLPAFLEAYRSAAASWMDEEFAKRAAVHCGVHLAYWPSMVDWADTDGTKKIIEYGAALIKGVMDVDYDWLKKSAFGPLFSS